MLVDREVQRGMVKDHTFAFVCCWTLPQTGINGPDLERSRTNRAETARWRELGKAIGRAFYIKRIQNPQY